MGYKNKKFRKDLHQQAYDRLVGMQAFGESKKEAIANGTERDKIFSYNTYRTYWQHTKYFVDYVRKEHPEVTSLKKARQYVPEWLSMRESQGLSAWTIQTEAKALGKLYGITREDKDYYTPPQRHRADIVRDRGESTRDQHFSKARNAELIEFCKGTGARREGISKLRGKDLLTREQINKAVERYEVKTKERNLSNRELTNLKILKDAQKFTKSEYFVYLKEKGGRERVAPIIGDHVDSIVERFRNTPKDGRVWLSVNTNAPIHRYRASYSNTIYKMYARDIDKIPYDRINKGTGRRYQSEVYYCRNDKKGEKLDKKAMLLASKALGHNRIDIVAANYLRD